MRMPPRACPTPPTPAHPCSHLFTPAHPCPQLVDQLNKNAADAAAEVDVLEARMEGQEAQQAAHAAAQVLWPVALWLFLNSSLAILL